VLILSQLQININHIQKCNTSKNTAKISEVGKYTSDSDTLFKTFENIIGQFKFAKVNALLNQSKSKGIEGEHIFKVLFALTFIDLKNVSQFMLSGYGTHLRYLDFNILYKILCQGTIPFT